MSQAGLGKPACQYSGAEFRQRAKGLAKRLGEPVERLAALCEALATTNAGRSQKPKLPARLLRDASADGGACWVTLVPGGGSEAVASVAAGAFHCFLLYADKSHRWHRRVQTFPVRIISWKHCHCHRLHFRFL